MAITQRFTRQQGVTPPPVNPAAGADASELSQELERFSSQRQAELAQRTEEQSFLAGQQAGSEGGAADRSEYSIAGRAFNRGALVAHQAALQTDIRNSVGQFAIENPEDPQGFESRVAGLSEGLLKEADPRLHPFIRQRVADYAGSAKLNILEAQHSKLRKESIGDLQRGAEGFFADATTAAFEGNVPMIEARRQELHTLLTEGVAGTLISEGDAGELKKKFEHEVTQQEIVGNFDRLIREKGIDAGNPAIDRWQATKASDLGLDQAEHEQVTRQMVTLLNREQSQAADARAKQNAMLAAETVTRRGRVADTIKVLKDGFSPPADQAKAVTEDIRWLMSTGDPADQARARELAQDFDRANAIQGQVHQFRRLPDYVRAQQLDELEGQLRRGGANAGQVQLLESLKAASASVDREVKNDPRGFAVSEGLIEDAPLDASSPENLAASIQARAANAEVGKQLTGQALPRLTASEAEKLAEVYQGTADNPTPIEQKIGLLGVITAGAGDDAVATLGQLDAKGNKRMALLGGMVMHGQGSVARDILRGEQVLAGTKGLKPTAESGYLEDVQNTIGSALLDWPEQRGLYVDAAVAKYAELKARAGDLSDSYDSRKMQQALNAVLPTAEFNDRRVAVPPGISEDAFEDWTEGWTADTFRGIPGADPEQLLELVRDRGRLVEVGFGEYGIMLDSAASGREKVLVGADGKPFRLRIETGQ